MQIRLAKFGKQLSGSVSGRKHHAEICGLLADAQPGNVVVLNFKGVQSVSGSWIDSAIAPLFCGSVKQNDLYPMLANFPEQDVDELELVARANHQCYPVATEFTDPIRHVRLIGQLDTGLRATVMKLVELGEATGAELARQVPAEDIQPTAWNNRLKDLYERRLLKRRKDGRQQVYSLVAERVVLND